MKKTDREAGCKMKLAYSRCWRISDRLSVSSENGFTMLEILAAIAILGITVIPLLGLFGDALVMHAQREQQTRAAFLAQLRLEEVKDKIISAPDFAAANYNKAAGAASDFPPPDLKFRYTVTHDYGPYIKEITVKVWYDEDGNNVVSVGEQEFELKTKVARRRP